VWVLTEDAVKNGVQSTTRYRKTGPGKRPVGGRMPAVQRQRAGARGGRAARNAAKRRHQGNAGLSDPMSTASPSTTSYSDFGDYQSYDYYEMHPNMGTWPITPTEAPLGRDDERDLFQSLSPPATVDVRSQHVAFPEENDQLQNVLVHPM
jgi:hypothetical protein